MDQIFRSAVAIGGVGTYAGPGDIVSSNWKGWWGLRAFSLASIGANVVDLVRDDAATLTVASVTGGGLDSAVVAWMSGHTAKVSKLYDQSAGGLGDMVQITDANRPAFTLNGFGSLPVITFSNASNTYLTTGTAAFDVDVPWSIVAFAKRTSVDTYAAVLVEKTGKGIFFNNTADQLRFQDGTAVVVSATDNVKYAIAMIVSSPAADKYAINGTVTGGQDMGDDSLTTTAQPMMLGNDSTFLRTPTGIIVEAGVNSTALSDANVISLGTQQLGYWGT